MPKYGRIDANQNEVVRDLRSMGLSVAITSNLGKGFPDIVVGAGDSRWAETSAVDARSRGFVRNGISLPVELKVPGGRLSAAEIEWWNAWGGGGYIAETAEEIYEAIADYRRRMG